MAMDDGQERAPGAPSAAVGSAPEGSPDPLRDAAILALRRPTPPRGSALLLLVVTLALFVLSIRGQMSWREVLAIVAVLFAHELGHWAGMRLFGYRDVRMFFIPFFGAAVSGRSDGVSAWKRGLVLLLGPLPGIVAALALGLSGAVSQPWIRYLAVALVSINGLNLLPLQPLDGGQLWQLALFSRRAGLEIVAGVVSGVGMGWLAFKLESWLMAGVGLAVAVSAIRRRPFLDAVASLRERLPTLPPNLADATGEQMNVLYAEARRFESVSPLLARTRWAARRRVPGLAGAMRAFHDHIVTPRPSLRESVGLVALGGLGFGLAMFTGSTIHRVDATWTPGVPEPLTQKLTSKDGAVILHYPATFGRAPKVPLGIRRKASGGEEILSWTTHATAQEPAAALRDLLRAKGNPVHQEATICHGEPGVEALWRTRRADGLPYEERACAFIHAGHAHVVLTIVPAAIAEVEAPVLREIVERVEVGRATAPACRHR
ncbi:Zn-dependent protease [Minicystis rosea]|nr:Zn-dependent protease [Minicystis rosea]